MDQSAPLMLSVSGCRGIFGRSITPEVAARFAMAAAELARERVAALRREHTPRPRVVLGRDGRAGGEVLARAAAAGLSAGGCDVIDLGVAMTPTVGVMVDARAAAAGLVITASHNPQQWNGLKLIVREGERDGRELKPGVVDACAPGKTLADRLIARFRAAGPIPGVEFDRVGMVHDHSATALDLPDEGAFAHVERVREALKAIGAHDDRRSMGVKAVLDSVNSSGRAGGKELLGTRLVHHLGAGTHGLFPHEPEPTREHLATLCRFVTEKHADIGFAQDPDADRLALIDERGEYIGEEYTLVLAAEAVLGRDQGAEGPREQDGMQPVVVTNLSTSRMIDDVAARHGARVIRTAVGEANVVEAMKREHAVIGGEGNGGVIWPRVTYIRDSLSAMGLVIALMAREQKTLSQLVAAIPSYAIVKRKVELREQSHAAAAVEAVAAAYSGERIDRQDGVRVDFDSRRAWLHVRASNTEPIMRLIAEAPSREDAEAILADAQRVIGK